MTIGSIIKEGENRSKKNIGEFYEKDCWVCFHILPNLVLYIYLDPVTDKNHHMSFCICMPEASLSLIQTKVSFLLFLKLF